ncbi:hypothetical protein C0J29_09900 [Mycobacterium paragordonae]|nr:hypothetical protein C0J29_09900 [Mycobacterium paragordonae]OBK62540.1 hypothetical protein A5656_01535 [Mycobacterium gordonae]PJE24296.1 MAG: hypothetical protein CK431_06810 [Mycobacterium sp.]
MTLFSTLLRPRATEEREVRSPVGAAPTDSTLQIAARTAAVSHAPGAYQTTTDAVRGYACTARTPVTLATVSSIAEARK